jgi:TetR/AcrR family transcriptional regulator, regulator of cefoperazone and chloramphenicol sensitivity
MVGWPAVPRHRPATLPSMSPTRRDAGDLTARARLRDAALELFAERGIEKSSVRAIAQAAGVSPGLIRHHFGGKDGLRAAVDQAMVERFSAGLARAGTDLPPDDLAAGVNAAVAEVVGSIPHLAAYLRRSFIEDTPASRQLFARFLTIARTELARLRRAGLIRPGTDMRWAPYQLIFLIAGPLLLEPAIEDDLGVAVFAPHVIRRRSAANLALLTHGLFLERSASD